MFVNNLWRHYKGGRYLSFGTGFLREELVVYRSLDSANLWLRPRRMWFEKVNGVQRFALITDQELASWALSQLNPQYISRGSPVAHQPIGMHTETNELLSVRWIGAGEFKLEHL